MYLLKAEFCNTVNNKEFGYKIKKTVNLKNMKNYDIYWIYWQIFTHIKITKVSLL